MKVGITCYPTYGGSGIVATELGMELADRGHEVHFVTYANPIRLDQARPLIHYHEVEVAAYPLFQHQPYTLALASRMSEVVQTYGLDVLHVHYAIPHSVSALLAQMMCPERRVPVITTLHGTDITLVGLERSYFPITRFSIENSDGVTSVSQYLAKQTRDVFGIRKKIEVIPNFVNCELYHPTAARDRVQPFVPAGDKVLMHISNFRPVKRVKDCLYVLKRVREEVPAHLLMVGDGPDRVTAETLAQDLGLSAHVSFLGKQGRIHELLPQADILLLPSQLESFGLVALEAMACAVPPIATNVGGLSEVVTDGVNGFLRRVSDIEGQAECVVRLLQDRAEYEAFAERARQTALQHFCASIIIPRYEDFYKELLQS